MKKLKKRIEELRQPLNDTIIKSKPDHSLSQSLRQHLQCTNTISLSEVLTEPTCIVSLPTREWSASSLTVAPKSHQETLKKLEKARLEAFDVSLQENELDIEEESVVQELIELYKQYSGNDKERRMKHEEMKGRKYTFMEVESEEDDLSQSNHSSPAEMEEDNITPQPPAPSFGGGLFGNKKDDSAPQPPAPSFGSGLFGNKKNDSTPQPPAPSFGSGLFGNKKNDSTPQPPAPSFGSGGGLFGNKDTSTLQPPAPSFGGGLFGKKNDSAPQPPAPSFGSGGLFGNKDTSTLQPPAPSFSSGGLFSKKNDSAPQPPAPSFGGGLFGNKKDDSKDTKNEPAPQPPAPSFSSGGLFGSKKDATSTFQFSFGKK